MIDAHIIKKRLLEAFLDAEIQITDLTGTGDHWEVSIKAREFSGKSLIEQHKMVYKALESWINKEIHALALHTSCFNHSET